MGPLQRLCNHSTYRAPIPTGMLASILQRRPHHHDNWHYAILDNESICSNAQWHLFAESGFLLVSGGIIIGDTGDTVDPTWIDMQAVLLHL